MIEAFSKIPGGEKYVSALMSVVIENMAGTELGPLKKINRMDMVLNGLVKPETKEEEEALSNAMGQSQENPQSELIDALTRQANAEATKFESEARNQDSDSIDNIASAEKKAAETRKIISETMDNRLKTLKEIREQTFNRARALPI